MRGEGEWQAKNGGKLRAEEARAEDPERHLQSGARNGGDALTRFGIVKVGAKFDDILRKVVGGLGRVAPQGSGSQTLGPGGASEPQIDAARKERFKRPELFSDHQRTMVGSMTPPDPTRIVVVPPAT